jgi:hypothetical protein
MTEIGWVIRKIQKGQRWGLVGLTASGRKLIVQIAPMVIRRFATFEAALGQQQLEQLGELLLKARTALRDMLATSPKDSSAGVDRAPRRRKTSKAAGARPKDRRTRP